MLERTKKRPIDKLMEARFIGSHDKIVQLREVAKSLGLRDTSEYLTIEEAFPGYGENPLGMALKGARSREGVTQRGTRRLQWNGIVKSNRRAFASVEQFP